MNVNLYPQRECILTELSNLLCFQYELVGTVINNFGCLQNSYSISEKCYVRKSDLDNFIIHSNIGDSSHARASVLYSLYACRYLVVTDIKYPTYQDWKNQYHLSLDHKLPRRWFPQLTFDCSNWQPKSSQENQDKGDDFLAEGLARLEFLASDIHRLKHKYM